MLNKLKQQLKEANDKLVEAIGKEDLASAKEQRSIIADITKKIEDEKKAEEKRALESENEKAEIEKRELQKQKELRKDDVKMEKRSYKSAVKSLKEGKVVSTRTIQVAGSTTEAVLPEEFLKEVEKLEAEYGSLESYCEVIPVTSLQGKRPVTELGGKLTKLTPGQKLPEGSVAFTQLTYDVEGYGEIVAVDNQLDEDAAVDIFSTIKENFAVKSVNTKNEAILEQVEANKKSELSIENDVTPSGDLIGAIIDKIDEYKPSVRRFVKVLANSTLRAKIKNNFFTSAGAKDERITIDNGVVYIDGHEVVEFDETLANETAMGYIVPMKSIKFFKRKGLEIATSTEVYFDSNAEAIRVVERFDVNKLDKDMVKSIKITA